MKLKPGLDTVRAYNQKTNGLLVPTWGTSTDGFARSNRVDATAVVNNTKNEFFAVHLCSTGNIFSCKLPHMVSEFAFVFSMFSYFLQ